MMCVWGNTAQVGNVSSCKSCARAYVCVCVFYFVFLLSLRPQHRSPGTHLASLPTFNSRSANCCCLNASWHHICHTHTLHLTNAMATPTTPLPPPSLLSYTHTHTSKQATKDGARHHRPSNQVSPLLYITVTRNIGVEFIHTRVQEASLTRYKFYSKR